MQFEDATQAVHRDVRIRIESAMETGNFDHARTVLTEYEDVWPKEAKGLRHALIGKYNTSL